jgi:cation diffusion facilitator family transporter
MNACCDFAECATRQRRVLRIVLWVNAAMFLAEFGASLIAHSTALLSDSVDMLGDAIVYGFSLYAVMRGPVWHARAALLKGSIMGAFGCGVLLEAAMKLVRGVVPSAGLIAAVGIVALAANLFCLLALARHRGDDINMRSAWLCSRNDVVANVGVLLAATGVGVTGVAWPDILIGLVIAAMFGGSSLGVIRAARQQLRASPIS